MEFEKDFDDEVYEDSFYNDEEELDEDVLEEDESASEELDDFEDDDEEDDDLEDDDLATEDEPAGAVQGVKVDLSLVCDDCDYRWDDTVVQNNNEYEEAEEITDVVCPMCGSMNVTQI